MTWEFFVNRDALEYLSEWQRPNFLWPLLWPYVLAVLAIGYLAFRRRLHWADAIVIVPFAIFGTLATRSVFPALLVLLPFAAQALRPSVAAPPRSGIPILNWGIAAAIMVMTLLGVTQSPSINERVSPPAAARAALGPGRAVPRPGSRRGLIYTEWPDRLVYVDDRAELYGAEMFQVTIAAMEGEGYDEVFARWELDQALLKADWALVEPWLPTGGRNGTGTTIGWFWRGDGEVGQGSGIKRRRPNRKRAPKGPFHLGSREPRGCWRCCRSCCRPLCRPW